MKILDLTHLIEEAMPVYPETEPPKLTPSNTFEQHGFRETLLTMGSHTGTHMDAPAHMLRDGKTLDQFPADKYIGTAYVLDCSDLAGKEIPKARLQLHASEIEAADFLLFYTGWEKYWGSEQYLSLIHIYSHARGKDLGDMRGVHIAERRGDLLEREVGIEQIIRGLADAHFVQKVKERESRHAADIACLLYTSW